jgi:LmbE family N-acetylglucosaminyl deacetylase
MKILTITAHPDDLEIACSGTLKKLQLQGADIISIITVAPSEEVNTQRSKEIVSSELLSSYNKSNFELRILNTELHSNGRPNLVCDNNTMTQLADLLEPCDLAIIPNPQDWHQDHRTTYNLAWPLVQKLAKEVWLMDSWPYSTKYTANTANLFYNISEHWQFKQSLLACYNSYITEDDIANIKISNQWHGLRTKTSFSEAFTIVQKHVN